MYHLKVCRSGTEYGCINKGGKGAFYKDFDTLSDIVDFLFQRNGLYFVEPIKKSLSKKEFRILVRKYASVQRKKYASVIQ